MKKKSIVGRIILIALIVCALLVGAIFAYSLLVQKKSFSDIIMDEEIRRESEQASKAREDILKDISARIENLPEADEITLNEKEEVRYVYQIFSALSEEDQAKIENRNKLIDCAARINELIEEAEKANSKEPQKVITSGNAAAMGAGGSGMGGFGGGGSGYGSGTGTGDGSGMIPLGQSSYASEQIDLTNKVSSFNDFASGLQEVLNGADFSGVAGSDFLLKAGDNKISYDIYYQSTLMGSLATTDGNAGGKSHGIILNFYRSPNSHSLMLDLFSDMQYAVTRAMDPDLTHEEAVNIVNRTIQNANGGDGAEPYVYKDVSYLTRFLNADRESGLLSYTCEYLDGRYFSLD